MIKNNLKYGVLLSVCFSTISFSGDNNFINEFPDGLRVTINVPLEETVEAEATTATITSIVVTPETVTPVIEVLQSTLTPEEQWNNYFSSNFQQLRETALNQVVKPSHLFKKKNFLGREIDQYWPSAIQNFKNVMDKNPLPPIKKWAIRGTCKKYNKNLLQQINDNIEAQKTAWIVELIRNNTP